MPFEVKKSDDDKVYRIGEPAPVTNPVEPPAEEPANVGEKVAVTNPIEPIVVYSDVPGAGPNDVPPEPDTDDDDEAAVEEPEPEPAPKAAPAPAPKGKK